MSEGPPTSGTGSDAGAQPAQPEVPAGWYPHPTAPGWEAYWTGSGWGTETRPAQQAQPAAPAEPAAQQGAVEQAPVQDAGAEQAVAAGTAAGAGAAAGMGAQQAGTPAEAQPAEPQYAAEQPAAQTESQPVATTPAETQTAAQPAEAQPQTSAGTEAAAPAAAQTGDSAPPAAVPAGAVATGAAEARPASALPALICILGAIVAIVGAFLPEAKLEFNGNEVDLADNTMFAAGYGIAVIAAAAIGAAIAAWAYVKKMGTWLPVLLGVVVLGIAVYAGTAGLDVTPSFAPAGLQLDGAGDPSTGIFAVGIGGLLMILGGIGLARDNR